MFNVGLLFLMISISKIKHSSFPRHLLRTVKILLRFIRVKLCFSKKCLPVMHNTSKRTCMLLYKYALNGMFVFLYALMEVTARVTDIICIAQITFEFINNILLVH